MQFTTKQSNIIFKSDPSSQVVGYTDPDGDFFDRIPFYSYTDNPAITIPNEYSLYKGQKKYDLESRMYSQLSSESVVHTGGVVEYYVTTYNRSDKLYGEDNNRRIIRTFDFMAHLDDIPKGGFTLDMYGISNLELGEISTPMKHFEAASTKASLVKDDKGVDQGFLVNEESVYESIEPCIGDLIRLKSDDIFYEIMFVDNRDEIFLQRKHHWKIKFRKYVDDQMTISNENNQKELMEDLSKVTDRRGEGDLFDVKEFIKENRSKTHYNGNKEEQKPQMDDATASQSINDWFKQ